MPARRAGLIVAVLLVLPRVVSGAGRQPPKNPFSLVDHPTREQAQAIGSYNAGCIAGAARLPLSGAGYSVARPERRRFFGHPLLLSFIQALGTKVREERLGSLIVGDLAQPRGGPTLSGHRSHQNGLDADLSLVVEGEEAPPQNRARALELAASFPQIERIFVHPTIKRALCEAAPTAEWLRKIRPFWGHLDHFHVRLGCPSGEEACVAQKPLAEGNGCGTELSWWFSTEAQKTPPKAAIAAAESLSRLPPACAALVARKP